MYRGKISHSYSREAKMSRDENHKKYIYGLDKSLVKCDTTKHSCTFLVNWVSSSYYFRRPVGAFSVAQNL